MERVDTKVLAELLRKTLGVDQFAPVDIFTLVLSIDELTLILYPMGSKISGICYKSAHSNLIAINSNMSLGRQRFSLAHELYHLFFDDNMYTVSTVNMNSNEINEVRANEFATNFLVPQASLIDRVNKIKSGDKINEAHIIDLEQYYGISHKAMLEMLVNLGEISEAQMDVYNKGIRAKAAKLGYETKLYESSPEDENIKVLGHYVRIVNKLYDENSLSKSEFNNLIKEAFREDLVIE